MPTPEMVGYMVWTAVTMRIITSTVMPKRKLRMGSFLPHRRFASWL